MRIDDAAIEQHGATGTLGEPSIDRLPIEFDLGGAHLGDLLMALPAIGAAAGQARVVVSGLPPRHFTALRALPVAFRQTCERPAHTLRPRFQSGMHRTLAWLQAVGEGVQPVRIPIPVQGLREAEAMLPAGNWALLSPWADYAGKRWSMHRWAALAGALQERGYVVALIGPPPSKGLEVVEWPAGVVDLRGCDSATTWPALLTRASLVVSVDTGCLHMADALGIPVVGLYSVAHPSEYAPFWQRSQCVHSARMEEMALAQVIALVDRIAIASRP